MDSDSGLIYSYLLDGKGGGKILSWEEIKKWNPEKGTIWLHLDLLLE